MFALAMAGEREKVCRRSVVCRGEKGEWVKKASGVVWFSGRNRRVGQEGQRRSVVCRAKTLRGSKKLSLACGLSGENAAWVKKASGVVWSVGRKRCVGQRNCR